MNDPVRNSFISRSSNYAQRGSLIDDTSSVQGPRGSVVQEDTESARSSMVSVRSTMPPAPREGSEASSSAASAGPLAGFDEQKIQEGVKAAEKVGVWPARVTFWGKLAGTVVTGLGMVAFGVLTGGAGPLAVAGLALTGAFFLKSCGDTHMARLQLQNARGTANHNLPCGPDAVAHLLYRPFAKRACKGIDPENHEAMAQAQEKAKKWAKGVSLTMDLTLGVSATAVTGLAQGQLIASMSALSLRLLFNGLASALAHRPPEKYQQDSIDLAKRDLAFVEGQLSQLRVDEPASSQDPEAMHRYQEASAQLASLHGRFQQIRDQFEQSLQSYEQRLDRLDPSKRAGIVDGISEMLGAGSDSTDMGLAVAEGHGDRLAVFSGMGLTALQCTLAARRLNQQEGLEKSLTQAFLDMNRDLKTLSKDAFEFKAVLGLMDPPDSLAPSPSTEVLNEPVRDEPIRVLSDPLTS